MTLTKYRIELVCNDTRWWNFNVFLIVAGYDVQNRRITFDSLEDRVRDIGSSSSAPCDGERAIVLETEPCAYAEVYMYAVANTLPDSAAISETPPFPLTLRAGAEGCRPEETIYDVNQLGGLTIVAHRVGMAAGGE